MRKTAPASGGRPALVGALATLVMTAGCQSARPYSELMEATSAVEMSARELRIRLTDFVARFSGAVESAAEEIATASDDPELRRRTLLWRVNAITAAHRAAFQADPMAGLLDIWTLCLQMRDFFEAGDGREAFGEWQSVAVAAARRLEEEATGIARATVSPEDWPARAALVDAWVEEHPVRGFGFLRESSVPLVAEFMGRRDLGTLAAVGSVAENLEAVTGRLTLYTDQLPKQMAWQTELLLGDLVREHGIEGAVRSVNGLDRSLARIADVSEGAPELVAGEREMLLASLRGERAAATRFLDLQRDSAVAVLREERAALTEAVDEMVARAFREHLRRERVAAVAAVEEMTLRTLEEAHGRAEELVDRLLWGAGALLVLGLGILAGGAYLFVRSLGLPRRESA